jgi:hypothetical protein
MLCRRSLGFTAFTPLSVRFTTSGWVGIPGVGAGALAVIGVDGAVGGGCWDTSNLGRRRIAPTSTTALTASRFPCPVTRFPLPAARFPIPATRSPLPRPSSLAPRPAFPRL